MLTNVSLPYCTQVAVSSNKLRTGGLFALAAAVSGHKSLKALDCSKNQGDWKDSGSGHDAQGMVSLAEALSSSLITNVNMANNIDRPENAISFAKQLSTVLSTNMSITQVRFVYKCARKQQQKAHSSDYFCLLSCLQISFCTLYTG